MASRRQFLASAAAALSTRAQTTGKRPNILLAIADDWSWPFASIAGDRSVHTPNFDRIAKEGVLFPHAYCVSPSCTPSRGSILTGQWFARLESGADLWSALPAKFPVYPDLLESAGYAVGFTGKGWGPGDFKAGGRMRNPAGPEFNQHKADPPWKGISNIDYTANFREFLSKRQKDQPFCFWYGGIEPHRVYEQGSGLKAGKKLSDVRLPGALPDKPEVRSDLLDYAVEIDWFDKHLGQIMRILEENGELENTLIAVTGDNGLPFPRCKTNLYDSGTNVPLAIRFGSKIKSGREVQDFVSLADLAPTFLEAAGVTAPPGTTARSLMNVLTSSKSGWVDPARSTVLTGRERHTVAQPDGTGGYPMRSIRTRDFLYIRNYRPERFPAGSDTKDAGAYRDIDAGPAKQYMMDHRSDPSVANFFELGFGKRPAEEFYDLRNDGAELRNVAADSAFAKEKQRLAVALEEQLKKWNDPRALGGGDAFDTYHYFGKW